MVSTPLKNTSQIGSSSQLLGKTKNVPNHQPVVHWSGYSSMSISHESTQSLHHMATYSWWTMVKHAFLFGWQKKHQLPSPQYRPPHELGVGRLSIWLCSGSNCQSTGGPPKWNLIKLCWPYLVGLSQYIVGLSQYVIIQLLYYSNPLIMLLDYHPTTSIYIKPSRRI